MRGEHRAVADRVREAVHAAAEAGVLGRDVLGSGFSFAVTLVGADLGFMGGEESTLIQVIKGRPAKAQQRPPYPTDYGIFEKPTAVLNVETLANLPLIISRGGLALHVAGTQMSPGTKLLTVLGPDGSSTLIEVSLGTPI